MTTPVPVPPNIPRGRFIVATSVLVIGWLSPLLIPVVTASALPGGLKTVISSLLLVGIPEIFTLGAAAILGKEGFNYLKQRIFRYLLRFEPPELVSRKRYQIGLVLFVMALIMGWIWPYLTGIIPNYEQYQIPVAIAGDAMLVISIFVLGGAFWDKLRALFFYRAVAQFPERQE